jgi:hypothetical protein
VAVTPEDVRNAFQELRHEGLTPTGPALPGFEDEDEQDEAWKEETSD